MIQTSIEEDTNKKDFDKMRKERNHKPRLEREKEIRQ